MRAGGAQLRRLLLGAGMRPDGGGDGREGQHLSVAGGQLEVAGGAGASVDPPPSEGGGGRPDQGDGAAGGDRVREVEPGARVEGLDAAGLRVHGGDPQRLRRPGGGVAQQGAHGFVEVVGGGGARGQGGVAQAPDGAFRVTCGEGCPQEAQGLCSGDVHLDPVEVGQLTFVQLAGGFAGREPGAEDGSGRGADDGVGGHQVDPAVGEAREDAGQPRAADRSAAAQYQCRPAHGVPLPRPPEMGNTPRLTSV